MRRQLQKLWIGCCKLAAIYGGWWLVTHIAWQYTAIMTCWLVYALKLMREYDARPSERFERRERVDVSRLSPLGYEDYCAVLLRDAGWRASTTPRQDQGVDVIATLRGTRAAIQCKMYASPVGNRAVQEVIAGRIFYGAQLAVVVSTAPYTYSARILASRAQVLLLHHDQLPALDRLAGIR